MRSLLLGILLSACAVPDPVTSEVSSAATNWNGGSEDPNGEVIVVEGQGTWDNCLDGGVCWNDLDEDPIDYGDTGGGGGGGGSGSGDYEPQPKDCTAETDKIACEQCCDWNTEKVDRPACNKRYRNDKNERRKCYQRAETANRACIKSCKELHIFEAGDLFGAGQ